MKYEIFDTGYHIIDENGDILYTAYNHPLDSQIELPKDHHQAVTKDKLKKYAQITLDQWEG
jgi:hypothetical protein